ncbi:hypothetical protein [Erythrobacter sp.]|uniref:hypothetical protein n=1 Tax=Erythrobacter sp. TaxID=1042 RepID=UPI0025CFAF17|nr:hypothetical protein [Erythrobacter sp.]
MIRFLAQALLLTAVFIGAWLVGGKPEKYVATIYFSMLVIGALEAFAFEPATQADYENLHEFRFILDLAALAGVVFVALHYDRWWTLWVGSAQFVAVTAHLLRMLDMPIPALAYTVMERWPVWIAIVLTAVGTCLHYRHRSGTRTDT